MKKAAMWEIAALVIVCLFSFSSFMARADDGAPTDYKNLEGGKWNNPAFTVSAGRYNLVFDVTLAIEQVADGKIIGVFTSREKFDKDPRSMPFSSNIEKTPDGNLRFIIKIIWSGNSYRYDLQEDGNFMMSSPPGTSAVLKRVVE
jgi:hypothetical protein